MEKRESDIIKLKQQINTNKIKMQSLKIKMQNEDNDSLYNKYKRDYNDVEKLIKKLNQDLDKEIESDKKEKLHYKKALIKLKQSLNDFSIETRTNTKNRKNVSEIAQIIINIEKYLD